MSLLPVGAIETSAGGYNVNNSLRFRSSASASLTRTFATSTDVKKLTYSAWVKRGTLGVEGALFAQNVTAGTFNVSRISFNTSNQLYIATQNGSAQVMELATTQVFRDISAWYHIVIAIDTTQATSTNRVKVYVNGLEVTSFSTATYPSLNADPFLNTSSILHGVGAGFSGGATSVPNNFFLDGYLEEVNFIDGQELTPSSFGETNATTGVWQPKAYTGTYGINGFYLNFSDIALTSGSNAGLGKDFSGNGNYWNTTNISVTTGTTYDAMTDVPTNTSATASNYAVISPLASIASTITNGNLSILSTTTANRVSKSSIAVSSGKWYWEIKPNVLSASGQLVGVTSVDSIFSGGVVSSGFEVSYYSLNGNKYVNGTASAYGATWAATDTIGIALDVDGGTVTFYKNNVSQGSISITASQTWVACWNGNQSTDSVNFTFGQRPFTYTPPTGFVSLNTFNLPDSTIVKGNSYMDATLYTGTGASLSVTNDAGFRPDFVWVKGRSGATNHALYDAVRGTTNDLVSNSTAAETTQAQGLTAFNSNGFTVGTLAKLNTNTATYVGWQWQAGSSTVTNTSGSISAQVRANTTTGFSVVTYTGTGANATVGHGLGVAPKFIIVKGRSNVDNWQVYHSNLTSAANRILLNTTAAQSSQPAVWNSTAPTSSVFSLGTGVSVNQNGQTFVAYCWAEIAGFSKFGSYTGNGSADGPFVYTGFIPAFIMTKCSSSTGNWVIYDTKRLGYNTISVRLYPNIADAQSTNTLFNFDIVSNGFKIRSTSGDNNLNGATYIYAAFAVNPFKNSLAR